MKIFTVQANPLCTKDHSKAPASLSSPVQNNAGRHLKSSYYNLESGDFLLAGCVSEGLFAAAGEDSQVWGLSWGRDVDTELFTLGSEH